MNEAKLRNKPYPGMGNISKSEGLYKKKSPEQIEKWKQKLGKRLDTNLISERGLSFSLLQAVKKGNLRDSNIKRLLSKSYKLWWMADVISWKIAREYNIELYPEEREIYFQINEEILEMKVEMLEKLRIENPRQFVLEVPNIGLSSWEIRNMLGKPRLTNKEIHDLMWGFSESKYQRVSSRWKDKENQYTVGEFKEMLGGEVKFIKTENLINRTQEPEYAYLIIFNKKEGLDFFYSVHLGFFDFRGASYYSMAGGSQQIFRFVGWTPNPTYLKLEELNLIAGIKDRNRTQQQKTVEKYLQELQDENYIQGWCKDYKKVERVKKLEIRYTIFKIKKGRLPKK